MFSRFLITLLIFTAGNPFISPGQSNRRPWPQGEVPYRLAGFQFPENPRARAYRLEISLGHWSDRDSFQKYRIKDTILKSNRSRVLLPAFDQAYTWVYTPLGRKHRKLGTSPYLHLKTGYHRLIDSQYQRLEIITPSKLEREVYVFADQIGVLYDLQGNPVWYLPDWPADSGWGNRSLRDLKPSPVGTLTGINTSGAYEMDFQGQILWKAPDLDSMMGHKNRYHHQMDRLPNGHYLVLGEETAWIRLEDTTNTWRTQPTPPETEKREDGLYQRFLCGTLIEYDSEGRQVWSWSSQDYFRQQLHPYNAQVGGRVPQAHAHLNGFFWDSLSSTFLLSFRDLSQIFQIAYPSGELIKTFGNHRQVVRTRSQRLRVKAAPPLENLPFHAQHHPSLLNAHTLMIFNNQGDGSAPSDIRIFRLPEDANSSLHPDWTFSCDLDSLAPPMARRGGSIYALPDLSLLVCMGNAGRIFIVDGERNLLWNALPYSRIDPEAPWRISPLYRASPLYGPAIDSLLFGPRANGE